MPVCCLPLYTGPGSNPWHTVPWRRTFSGTAGTQTEVDLVETPAPKPNPNVSPSQNINYAYVPNRIMVSTLTGRARLLKPRIQ